MSEAEPLLWSSVDAIRQEPQASPSKSGHIEPTKEEFLRLFMEQLKNQDPLNPMDQQDITAQLATISNLEQNVRSTKMLGEIRDSLKAQESWQGASWVGKQARVRADLLQLADGQPAELSWSLPSGVQNVNVKLVDKDGNLVRTFAGDALGDAATAAGGHALTWDGTDHRGTPSPAGTYRIQVDAVDHNGRPVAGVRTELTGAVESVSKDDGVVRLWVAGRRVLPEDVLEIR